MRALVTVASKHGATLEIGQAVADALAEHDVQADLVRVEDQPDPGGYDAVVLGSAVYAGHWLEAARDYVEQHADALSARPVWLLSSGPVGDPPKPEEDPVDAAGVMAATSAREHRVFAGKLDRSGLGFGERAIVTALRAPQGDFRDWDAIRQWAVGIARALT